MAHNAELHADVLIAGGGPAGLAAAIAASQRGMSAIVADRAHPPIDKACGEGIMPDGVEALAALGVELGHSVFFRLEGVRFLDAAGEVGARFPHGAGLGVRRPVLHAALAAQAERLGVTLAWGTRVESLRQGEAVAGGRTIRARYLICADGQNSTLRQTAGFGAGRLSRRRYGFRRHYRIPPWSPFVEVHWAACGQAYVTPVGPEEICVALLTSDSHARLETALPSFPALQEKLREAHASCATNLAAADRSLGGITATRRLQAVTRGNIALLGDAAGSADAITGDGLSLAFQHARALADAMASGELRRYQREHERLARLPRAMGELMLLLNDSSGLRGRVFAAFERSPEMFAQLLAVHTRGISPMQLGVTRCLKFGWKMLCA